VGVIVFTLSHDLIGISNRINNVLAAYQAVGRFLAPGDGIDIKFDESLAFAS
jgi:hypothetical protein